MKTTTTNSHMMLRPLALSIALGLCSLGAQAQTAAPTATPAAAQAKRVDIAALPAAEALQRLVEQTKFQLIYSPDILRGVTTKAVNGTYTLKEALERMLEGTGLKGVETGVNAATIRSMSANDAKPDSAGIVGELQKVEVTGSRLKRIDAEGPVPVNVYTREDIAKSGQPNLQRFLASLTEVSESAGEGTFSSTLGHGTVQLRGMPQGSTLVLINGRKVQAVGSFTGTAFNLNLIPAGAIERVEVVPQGSSAIYGGDALAGVVNVILKKSIDGQSFTASAGAAAGYDDQTLSFAVGRSGTDSQFMVMGGYSRSSPLSMKQRDFFQSVDFRSIGGPDGRREYCTPGTVRSVSGNLPGLNSNVAGIPARTSGQPLSISDFQATAGSPNLCNQYAQGVGLPIIYGYETASLHVLGERKLFGDWTVFTELTHVRDRMEGAERGSVLFGETVPASNAFNPFGVAVTVSAVLGNENGLEGFARQTNFTRALLGVKGELGAGWDAEVTASTASDRGGSQTWHGTTNSAALAAALASSNPATALNPFTTGRAASDAVLSQIWSDSIRRSVGRKDQLTALARGAPIDLPAGPVQVAVGAEVSRDYYDVVTSTNATHGARSSSAVYGEARAPLIQSGSESGGRWDAAALTVAARRDHYDDFGSANTFQGGLELRPARSVLVRASAATSFKPPTITQLHTTETYFNAAASNLTDPARGGELVTSGTLIRGSNPALMPERGQSRSVGAVWEPEGGLGTRVGLTHWQMRIRDMIGLLSAQAILDAEAVFPGLVTREPALNGRPGIITSIRSTEVNFGRLETAGTDLDLAYGWKTGLGKMTISGGATRTSQYSVQLAPGAPVVDRLGRRFGDYWSPQWKGRLAFGIDQGAWTLGLTSRYLGSYLDSGTSDRRLGGFWLHDLAGTLNLKKMWPGLLPDFKTASLGASVVNLANRLPQYAQGVPYYDLTQADWRGRYANLRVTLDW